jgi:MerR family transcriptional regulator, copper efflux regulator
LGTRRNSAEALSDFLTIRQAASQLGVSASTLRNWDRAGKLKARRHPINGYRLYATEELDKLMQSVKVRK